jgi:hypothetical protein
MWKKENTEVWRNGTCVERSSQEVPSEYLAMVRVFPLPSIVIPVSEKNGWNLSVQKKFHVVLNENQTQAYYLQSIFSDVEKIFLSQVVCNGTL